MPLSIEKLRILTFPQRIAGSALDLHVLLLPTQRLLNVLDAFPSQLNPGTTVELPKFISARSGPRRGRHPRAGELSVLEPGDPGSRRRHAPDAADRRRVPAEPAGALRRARRAVQARRPGVGAEHGGRAGARWPTRTASASTCRSSYRHGVQLHHAAHGVREDRRQLSLRDQALVREEPRLQAVEGRDHLGPRDRVLPAPAAPGRADRAAAPAVGARSRPTTTSRTAAGSPAASRPPLADFDIVNADTELRSYAARIPPIDAPRQLFAALQFPVVAGPAQPNGDFDTLKIEAADYDDGFAKIVHVTQPVSSNLLSEEPDGMHPQKDIGVRLGWDDEQLLIWQNRQMLADPATPGKRIDAPLGVFFYRVDVRETAIPTGTRSSASGARRR